MLYYAVKKNNEQTHTKMCIKQCVALLFTRAAAYPEGSPLPLYESRDVTVFYYGPRSIQGFCLKISVLKDKDWTSWEEWTQRSLEVYFCLGNSAVPRTILWVSGSRKGQLLQFCRWTTSEAGRNGTNWGHLHTLELFCSQSWSNTGQLSK